MAAGGYGRDLLAVFRLVLCHDVGRDAAAVVDIQVPLRSVVYLALTYDHQLVDGADTARFLGTVKARPEEGAFKPELGL